MCMKNILFFSQINITIQILQLCKVYFISCLYFLFKFTYKMTVKQMNIKNKTYYFYNDLINLENFNKELLKLDKESSMGLRNVISVNPLYLMINRIDGFLEEKNGNKYLNISDTDRNSKVLKTFRNLGWN